MPEVVIEVKKIKKSYKMSQKNIINALAGVNLTLKRGDFTAIVGPSGCGKSTLMHIIGLLDKPDSGTVKIDGDDLSKISEKKAARIRSHKIGFIFQGFNLIPTLSALENVMLAGKYGGQKPKNRKKRAQELLQEVGLSERQNHKPSELSGGQQQRVALARALMNNPSIILADEPTGELDSKTSIEIIDILKKLNRENNQTFLIVTHNPEVADACKNTVRLIDGKNDLSKK